MAEPLVSIVLTTLNSARYLREAVDSCLGQTYRNLEFIVVDGGSTDGTLEILAGHTHPQMWLTYQKHNEGKLPGALNLGLAAARGDYLTWMQGDSIYHPNAIERMVEALETHPEVGHVYADFWQIDSDGMVQTVIQTCEPEEILEAKGDPCGVCFMIRRRVREIVGPHDVEAYPTQDYDYRMRIAMKFRSLRIPEPLYYWRLHPGSLSGSRPWSIDARNDVRIRLKLELSTWEQAQRDLAEIDIADAFEHFRAEKYDEVPSLVWAGLRRHWLHALNRGVWAITARSLARSTLGHKGMLS